MAAKILSRVVIATYHLRWLSEGVSSTSYDDQHCPVCYPLTCRWVRRRPRIFIGESRRAQSPCSPKSVVVLRFRRFCGFSTDGGAVNLPDALYLLARGERRVDALSSAWRAPIGCSFTAAAAAAAAIETSGDPTTIMTRQRRLYRHQDKRLM